MRCLYCGKELPLFKRLRGGEFCSDDHRKRYQEEYTQLALNRLLHANGSQDAEEVRSSKPASGKKEEPKPPAAKPAPESPALRMRERLVPGEKQAQARGKEPQA